MKNGIKTYNNNSFPHNFFQKSAQDPLLEKDIAQFFIVKFEDILRILKIPVPPVRSTNKAIVYLTKGEAVISAGSKVYKIKSNECLYVPASQFVSVDKVDLKHNYGFLCNFHNDFI
jgi:AraC family transcriptional regulator, transcriptional activator of pobA